MFDMVKCGRTISDARKKKNMTQMELADRMGISFQAVSNWERGVSMPDISKLMELSEVLGISVDEILGKSSPLIEAFVSDNVSDKENTVEELPKITLEEFKEAAPLLKPTQVDEVVKKSGIDFDLDEIKGLLPFLGAETCGKLFAKASEADDLDGMKNVVPFVSREMIDAELLKRARAGKDVDGLMPFVSKAASAEIGWEIYQSIGIDEIDNLAPYMPKEMLERIAETEAKAHGVSAVEDIAPFLNREVLQRLAKESIKKYGIESIGGITPYLGRDFLVECIRDKYL